MATLQARTRAQIRQAIARNVMGRRFVSDTASANGTTTTMVSNTLQGANDEWIGRWLLITSGAGLGKVRYVSDSAVAANVTTLTFFPAVTSGDTDSGVTYELYTGDFPPDDLNDYINDAIVAITGRYYDPEIDTSLHLHPDDWEYSLPSNIDVINRLEIRQQMDSVLLHNCDTQWDTVNSKAAGYIVTVTKRRGSACVLWEYANDMNAGDDIASTAVQTTTSGQTTLNLHNYDYVEFWIRTSETFSAGDLSLTMDDNVGLEETLAIPAITTRNLWNYFRLAIDEPDSNSNMTSIALDYTVDKTRPDAVFMDHVIATSSRSDQWRRIPDHHWYVDRQNQKLIFRQRPEYGLLKIVGGDAPALLSADATTSEVPEDYLIAEATARALLATMQDDSSPNNTVRNMYGFWKVEAERQKAKFGPLINARRTS